MKLIALLFLTPLLFPAIAQGEEGDPLTASQIETLENRGWITPGFETAARNLISARQTGRDARGETKKLQATTPGLEKSASAEDAVVRQLKAELTRYEHPDETDFSALQDVMKNPSAKTEDQMALAQAYVWTYLASPHAVEAEHDLQQLEKKIADGVQATKEADAKRLADQARLLQRVQARSLDLAEWRAFLQDKSQVEVVEYLGPPTTKADEYWTYAGTWTADPTTGEKTGLQLNFNGGRVLSVAPFPAP